MSEHNSMQVNCRYCTDFIISRRKSSEINVLTWKQVDGEMVVMYKNRGILCHSVHTTRISHIYARSGSHRHTVAIFNLLATATVCRLRRWYVAMVPIHTYTECHGEKAKERKHKHLSTRTSYRSTWTRVNGNKMRWFNS